LVPGGIWENLLAVGLFLEILGQGISPKVIFAAEWNWVFGRFLFCVGFALVLFSSNVEKERFESE